MFLLLFLYFDLYITQSFIPDDMSVISPFVTSEYCLKSGLALAIGSQFAKGAASCCSTPIGMIPSRDKMVSSLITSPQSGFTMNSPQNLTIQVKSLNLDTGYFSGKKLHSVFKQI